MGNQKKGCCVALSHFQSRSSNGSQCRASDCTACSIYLQTANKWLLRAQMRQLQDTSESGAEPLMKLIDISAAKHVNIHTNWHKTASYPLRSDFCPQMSQPPINCRRALCLLGSLGFHEARKGCGPASAACPLCRFGVTWPILSDFGT